MRECGGGPSNITVNRGSSPLFVARADSGSVRPVSREDVLFSSYSLTRIEPRWLCVALRVRCGISASLSLRETLLTRTSSLLPCQAPRLAGPSGRARAGVVHAPGRRARSYKPLQGEAGCRRRRGYPDSTQAQMLRNRARRVSVAAAELSAPSANGSQRAEGEMTVPPAARAQREPGPAQERALAFSRARAWAATARLRADRA